MNNDKTYQNLVHKMHEVSALPQQTLGPLTPLYRTLIPHVKEAPWRWFALSSFMVGLAFYIVFGTLVIRLVSILQHGF